MFVFRSLYLFLLFLGFAVTISARFPLALNRRQDQSAGTAVDTDIAITLPPACTASVNATIRAEIRASLDWLSASCARLSPNVNVHNDKLNDQIQKGSKPRDIYYNYFFQQRGITTDSYGQIAAIHQFQERLQQKLQRLLDTGNFRCAPDSDEICKAADQLGVYYNPYQGVLNFCKSWFDDHQHIPAATVEASCKGEEAKLYSVSQVSKTKRESPHSISGALLTPVAQTIISALIMYGPRFYIRFTPVLECTEYGDHYGDNRASCLRLGDGHKSDSVSGPIAEMTSSSAWTFSDDVELAMGEFKLPNDNNKCPGGTPIDDPRVKGDRYPFRCAMWNRNSHLNYITGKLRPITLRTFPFLTHFDSCISHESL